MRCKCNLVGHSTANWAYKFRAFLQKTHVKRIVLATLVSLLLGCASSGQHYFTTASEVAINQLGYLPKAHKKAAFAHPNASAIAWELVLLPAREKVLSGKTQVFGIDPGSQQFVHHIDFSEVSKRGEYQLIAGEIQSQPFSIHREIYAPLARDAFHYFHYHRMTKTADIEAPLACLRNWCDRETLGEIGGAWANAGGKDIVPVNHAFAVWALVNSYERSKAEHNEDDLGIAESGNGIPDLLDELRASVKYLPHMLPEGEGLASHRIGPKNTSPKISTEPSAEHADLVYYPPSTAATLAVARISAQVARVFKPFDERFAKYHWSLAKDAMHRAAVNPPTFVANASSKAPQHLEYDDQEIRDDWYAALTQTLITAEVFEDEVAAKSFRDQVRVNPYFLTFDENGSQSWQQLQGAASLSLWQHWEDTGLNFLEKDILKLNILEAAKLVIAAQNASGYFTPYNPAKPSKQHPFPIWQRASNAVIANDMMVLASAYYISLNHKYLYAYFHAFDYLLGLNALNTSFITGYGYRSESDTFDGTAWKELQENGEAYPKGWLSSGPMNDIKACQNEGATPVNKPAALAYAEKGTAPRAWCSKGNDIGWNASLFWIAKYAMHATEALH